MAGLWLLVEGAVWLGLLALSLANIARPVFLGSGTIRVGKYRRFFWWSSIELGHLLPLIILLVSAFIGSLAFLPLLVAVAAALAGLYFFEYAFVMAPQEIPNS